jgi:TetR/AcrR family transcriptional regulator
MENKMLEKNERPSRKAREAQRQRYEILIAAQKIFAQKGFHKASVNDIAKEAEFSVGLIYKLFESKDELYTSLMIQKMDELDQAVDIKLEKANNPYQQIEIIIEAVVDHLKDNRDFFKIYVNEADGFDWNIEKQFGKKIAEKYDKFIRDTVAIFEEGIADGFFEKLDPTTMAISLVGMLNGYCSYWARNPRERELKADAEVIKKIFLGKITIKKS